MLNAGKRGLASSSNSPNQSNIQGIESKLSSLINDNLSLEQEQRAHSALLEKRKALNRKQFIASSKFRGAKPGYIFRKSEEFGLGYHLDVQLNDRLQQESASKLNSMKTSRNSDKRREDVIAMQSGLETLFKRLDETVPCKKTMSSEEVPANKFIASDEFSGAKPEYVFRSSEAFGTGDHLDKSPDETVINKKRKMPDDESILPFLLRKTQKIPFIRKKFSSDGALLSRSSQVLGRGDHLHLKTPFHETKPDSSKVMYLSDDSSSSSDDESYRVINVEGCGLKAINGIYRERGLCDGVPKYFKVGLYEGRLEEFTLFRCKLADNTR